MYNLNKIIHFLYTEQGYDEIKRQTEKLIACAILTFPLLSIIVAHFEFLRFNYVLVQFNEALKKVRSTITERHLKHCVRHAV